MAAVVDSPAKVEVSVEGKEGLDGPVRYKLQRGESSCSRRFKEFETLHTELRAITDSEVPLPPLPEKHLIGMGLWRDREQALAERAGALEQYLNTVLETSNSEQVVPVVAEFLGVDPLSLNMKGDATGAGATKSVGIRGALSLAVVAAVGAVWIALLALWIVVCDAATLVVTRARAFASVLLGRASSAKSYASDAVVSRLPNRPRVADMPKPLPQLAELFSACAKGEISFSAWLHGSAAALFLHPPVVALVQRLPEEPRLKCARALKAVCPELVEKCSVPPPVTPPSTPPSMSLNEVTSLADGKSAKKPDSSASSESDTVVGSSMSGGSNASLESFARSVSIRLTSGSTPSGSMRETPAVTPPFEHVLASEASK